MSGVTYSKTNNGYFRLTAAQLKRAQSPILLPSTEQNMRLLWSYLERHGRAAQLLYQLYQSQAAIGLSLAVLLFFCLLPGDALTEELFGAVALARFERGES